MKRNETKRNETKRDGTGRDGTADECEVRFSVERLGRSISREDRGKEVGEAMAKRFNDGDGSTNETANERKKSR